jgi:hypothetical protein
MEIDTWSPNVCGIWFVLSYKVPWSVLICRKKRKKSERLLKNLLGAG